MNPRKITSLPRWLINIGLTLQFDILWAIVLFLSSLLVFRFFLAPEERKMCFFLGVMQLFILVVTVSEYVIYWLWDRRGNRRNAVIFLIVISVRLPPEINHPTLCFGGHGVTALPCLVIFWRKPKCANE